MATTRTKQVQGIVVPMELSKETKGTYVYRCDAEGVAVTTVYVAKEALGETAPANIVLTIAPVA